MLITSLCKITFKGLWEGAEIMLEYNSFEYVSDVCIEICGYIHSYLEFGT